MSTSTTIAFRVRSALRSRAETSGQAHADTHGVGVVLYEVHGGYEARAETDPPPVGSHRWLAALQPRVHDTDAAAPAKPKGRKVGK